MAKMTMVQALNLALRQEMEADDSVILLGQDIGIDGGVVPCHTVTSGAQVATDLALHHAALELLPGSFPVGTKLNTGKSRVVQKLIVADPEGGVPGLVVCVAVHGCLWLMWLV